MPKTTVTYIAPKGDSKVVEAFGHTFYDGQPQECELGEREIGKIATNPHFRVGEKPQGKKYE